MLAQAAGMTVLLLAAGKLLPAQVAAKPTLIITVTVDETRQPDAQVVIRPRGPVEGWPADRSEVVLTTDAHGRAAYPLPPGSYRILARYRPSGRLPTAARVTIKPGQAKPQHVYLQLLYWDCSVVKCIL